VGLSRSVAASMLSAAAVMGTAVVAVPMILHRVGTAGYGVWTLAGAVIVYSSILESGVGPAIQRDVAVSVGLGDDRRIHRSLWTVLLLYSSLGVVAFVVLRLAGPRLAGILDLQEPLRGEASATYANLGIPLGIVFLAASLGNVLQGLGRFAGLAMSAAAGGLVYLLAIPLLVGKGQVSHLIWAATLQQATVCLVRVGTLRDVWFSAGAPRLLIRPDIRRVMGFSARLQPWAVSELFNWQSDKVVVGVVASPTTLGHLGIGQQISDAGRLIIGAALNPVISSLATLAGTGATDQLRRRFHQLHRLWTVGIFGGAIISAATSYPLVIAWLGDGNEEAAVFAALLLIGSGFGLSTGAGLAYMRAVGRVGLEARFGFTILCANIILTIVLGITVGPYGVVAGTLGAYTLGAIYFFRRLRREINISPVKSFGEAVKIVILAAACAAISFLWGMAMATALPTGVALVPLAAGTLASYLVYGRVALGLRPRSSTLRSWLHS
jgi:O-antigen/teichoic acid export membrane protein